jgi:hypothetical protein
VKDGIVWKPLKGSQTLVMSCPANIILYHGTRGPGKTDAQLMRFRARVGQGYGRFWRGVIFDREYKNLDDLVSKSMRWFPLFKDGAKFLASKSDYKWVWPTGEELLFRAVKADSDYWGFHGQEFPFIGWNELTKYPSDKLYEAMMSCNRSSFMPSENPQYTSKGEEYFLPEIPLEIFATTNPFGSGHNWVKKRFINNHKPGQIQREVINVFNPRTQQREDIVRTSVHLFGSYKENVFLSPLYVASLEQMKDKNKRDAWLGGSWDIVSGGMFDDVWNKDIHMIKPFDIPANWRITRSYDHGSSKPFSVGWWAISDGSDVRTDAGWISTVKGDMFRIAEWYGCEEGKSNEGLRMLTADIARGIVLRQVQMNIHTRVQPGPADNSIHDVMNGQSVSGEMAKSVRLENGQVYNGVQWARSDKSPGSRIHGWSAFRSMLDNALPKTNAAGIRIPREKPGMFIFNTCKKFEELIPILPRSEDEPDDVDTDAEDHIGDEARYMVLSQGTLAQSGKTTGT